MTPSDQAPPQDRPLVWLPFDVGTLADPPDALTYATYVDGPPPAGVEDVELLVTAYDRPVDLDALLPAMPRLRVVQVQSAGYEHVLGHLPDGVLLCNARGVHDAATSELAVGLVLAAQRGLPDLVRAQDAQDWRHDQRSRSLADARVVVVGFGSIGQALARRLDGFECDVVPVASRARDGVHGVDELPVLLPDADVVVVLTPLTEATRHLVDAAFLARMPDGALLVNLSRGGVVDTDALLVETGSGRLRAALDVTDPEPLPPGHPLWTSPGVLLTPHVGGGTTAMDVRVRRLVVEQLRRFAAGEELLNVVAGA